MSAPSTFSPRVVAAMFAVGLLSFAGFTLVLAFAGGPRASDAGAHALSRSALGFAGIVQLLQDTGTPVLLSRGGAADTGQGLLVLTPTPGRAAPRSLPGGRPVLIILPKWTGSPDPAHDGWVKRGSLLRSTAIAATLPKDWPGISVLRRNATALQGKNAPDISRIDSIQSIAGDDLEALLETAADGGIVLGQADTDQYVLADPDLVNNQALATEAGAATALALLARLGPGPIVFDVSANGFGRSHDPLRMMFEPPLLGATLCALAATLLTGLLCARRFGPVRTLAPAVAAGPGQLADNAAALLARAGRERKLAGPYAELTRTLAARVTGAPRSLAGPALDPYLDQAGTLRGTPERFTALRDETGTVRSQAAMLRLAERLYRWRMGLVHGHR